MVLLKKKRVAEIKFLISLVKKFIKNKYFRNSVCFEHGMCACIGGLDRAHLHLMSIPARATNSDIKNGIDENIKIFNRKSGIKYIEYKDFKLENIHDINQILNNKNNLGEKLFLI